MVEEETCETYVDKPELCIYILIYFILIIISKSN